MPAAAYRDELFAEVLGIDYELAASVARVFRGEVTIPRLRDIPGMTNEVIERIKKRFVLTSTSNDE